MDHIRLMYASTIASDAAWLREHFDRCRDLIQQVLDRGIGTHNIDDVWDEIAAGNAQLWPTTNSVMITNVEKYPRAKVLRGWLAAGDLKEIVATEAVIRDWAKKQGCDLVILGGRRGWLRAFPGYRETHTLMSRRI